MPEVPALAGLPGFGAPSQRRGRGRPKGSGNKRSLDLARYIEATYAGQTPGQQSASIGMVTAAEVKKARQVAVQLGIRTGELSPVMVAMVLKAKDLATALGIGAGDAWVLMAKERMDLMDYVHQKQPAAAPAKPLDQLPTVYMIPGDAPGQVPFDLDGEDMAGIEIIEQSPDDAA